MEAGGAFGDLDRGTAADRRDLALEVTDAGFARVAVDDLDECILVELELLPRDAVLAELLGHQVVLRDRELLGGSESPEYADTTAEFGKSYEYLVQALGEDDTQQSEVSAPVRITPADTFAPAAPAGLTALVGTGSIELAWERNTEPDFRAYRVYRSVDGGEFARVGEDVETPAYSDRSVEPGKRYRYAVSSVDQAGNESSRSAIVEPAAQ